jgi:hypothetical protein
MKLDRMKKVIVGAGLVLTLLLGSGLFIGSTAQAQYRDRRYDSGRRADMDKGYRDGRDRGHEDARDRRNPDPNNSEHFRNGNGAYREGFRRGYFQGYREARRRRY